MKLVLLIAALACLVFATALGFGHFDDHADDLLGWLSLGLAFLASTQLPLER